MASSSSSSSFASSLHSMSSAAPASASSSPSPTSPSPSVGLLFDLDGTLADTDVIHRELFREMLGALGVNCDREFFDKHISGSNNRLIGAAFYPNLSTAEQEAIFIEKERKFRVVAESRLEALPGLLELLQFAKQNKLKIAAVTNAPKENVEMMMRVLKVREYFDDIILGEECIDDGTKEKLFGREVRVQAKPSPYPYLKAMQMLGVTPETSIVFEDSPPGVRAGAAANAKYVIGILTSQKSATLRANGATHCIHDFRGIALNDTLLQLKQEFILNNIVNDQ